MSYQCEWHLGSDGQKGINWTGTGAVKECNISVGLVLEQFWTV